LEKLQNTENDLASSLTLISGEKTELEENNLELKTKYEKVAHELDEVNQRNKV
jgi:predicted nuclease with TOPRIM domain